MSRISRIHNPNTDGEWKRQWLKTGVNSPVTAKPVDGGTELTGDMRRIEVEKVI